MPVSHDILSLLKDRFSEAMSRAFPQQAAVTIDPAITASKNPKFGDFQCNAAMALSKVLGRPPREVAKEIVAALDLTDLAEPLTEASIAGPGFINITIQPAAIAAALVAMDSANLGLEPATGLQIQTIVVDLCGVNLAKQLHVGHLRSTVIGDTVARVQSRLGHNVIRQNHVGDWGLPIAMVAARLIAQADAGEIDLATITLNDLDSAYKAAKKASDAETAALALCQKYHMGSKLEVEIQAQVDDAKVVEARGKETLIRLQAKDPTVYAVWQLISEVTMRQCLATCRDLNAIVLPEHTAGESAYADLLAPLVDDLLKRGIAEMSNGAAIIRIDDVEPGPPPSPPVLIRKSDGGFLYATTDLAAIRHRCQTLKADRVVYVVGAPQILHFKQVFAGAAKAGFTVRDGKQVSIEHAAFGAILGEDGKPFKTRSGSSAKLQDLVELAQERAMAAVSARQSDLPDAERAVIAKAVATAALRYTDLGSERIRDYIFSPERMVAFEGNTGPYLLYALVRIKSIFRKAAERFGPDEVAASANAALTLTDPAEKNLAMTLLRYGGVVTDVGRTLEPHRLCAYIYELAGYFATFFDACPVLTAPDEHTRRTRLRLCDLTQRVLSDGLTVLGIPTLERM